VQARIAAERALAQSLEQAVIVADTGGAIAFCSDQAKALLRKYFPDTPANRLPPALLDASARPKGLRVRRGSNTIIILAEEPPPSTPADLLRLGLTPRESEILFWVACGKTNAEVAVILGTATGTVKNQMMSILLKLRVETRLGAALKAMEVLGRS
jgi:DNA-binding CsgD family transcriptional regulator